MGVAGADHAPAYTAAKPFPSIVLDDFLPASLAERALQDFPVAPKPTDSHFDRGCQGRHKRAVRPIDTGERNRALFAFFNSEPFIQFLERLGVGLSAASLRARNVLLDDFLPPFLVRWLRRHKG